MLQQVQKKKKSGDPEFNSDDYSGMIHSLFESSLSDSGSYKSYNLQNNLGAQLIDRAIQSYLKDAIRNVEIKIFKVEIKVKGRNKKHTAFFVNRLELGYNGVKGNKSVYEKMDALRKVLNATNKGACRKAFETMNA